MGLSENQQRGDIRMKVLIVEDDEAIANLLYMDLSDEGYDCTCVYDGKAAADLLEESPDIDFILLDVRSTATS